MPTNHNEELGEQMDIEVTRAQASKKLAMAQAKDAYRQTQLSFRRIMDSNKALREAQVVILAYAESNGRSVQVTQALGMIEQAIINNQLWMAENQPF